MEELYAAIEKELNIDQETFDKIISDESAKQEICGALLYCLENLPEMADVASATLQYIAERETNADGGPGSGNYGHSGVKGQVGGSSPSGINTVDDKYFPKSGSNRRSLRQGWNKERRKYFADKGFPSDSVDRLERLVTSHVQGQNVDSEIESFARDNSDLIKAAASYEVAAMRKRQEDRISEAGKEIADLEEQIKETKDGIDRGEYSWYSSDPEELSLLTENLETKLQYAKEEKDRIGKEEPTLYRKGGYEDSILSFTTDHNGIVLYEGTDHEQYLTPDHQSSLEKLMQQGIYPVGGFGAKFNFYGGESSEITFVKLPVDSRSDADNNPKDWITVKGTHVPLDDEGKAYGKVAEKAGISGETVKKSGGSTSTSQPKANKEFKLSKETTPASDDYEFDPADTDKQFINKNVDKLMPIYKEKGMNGVEEEWFKTRLQDCTRDFKEIGDSEIDAALEKDIDSGVAHQWLREYNHEIKPKLAAQLTMSPEVHNAALNVMYKNYKAFCEESGEDALPFDKFLTTPIKMYRGGNGKEHKTAAPFSSYTFRKSAAEKFRDSEVGSSIKTEKGKLYEAEIRPIDTYGSLNNNGEMEIFVPGFIAPNGRFDGGPGSGNFGHEGREGKVGGSAPSDNNGEPAKREPYGALNDKAKGMVEEYKKNPYGYGINGVRSMTGQSANPVAGLWSIGPAKLQPIRIAYPATLNFRRNHGENIYLHPGLPARSL